MSGTDPGLRGELKIADRVVDKIASQAALGVSGVVSSGTGLGKVVGRGLPKVEVTTRGRKTRVGVEIAVVWPNSAAEVARSVRSAVEESVTRYAGLSVLAVDVTVAKLGPPSTEARRRVQ
ncbi:MAG: hypothetical protein AVDCRST_MAG72-2101 [uncultured Nocardioidaceae bacterium]|uniref:Alkaline shock protein 23 n=1 Tax=uncultured Nocardioidaceae bacterium TaxID=253824 RepID=A0A6J4MH65_9ACTN|nr:MAG: hypothetical protein AVDCRST_MAG72-2101 [uncultured Nocardioidaceae bacterium]